MSHRNSHKSQLGSTEQDLGGSRRAGRGFRVLAFLLCSVSFFALAGLTSRESGAREPTGTAEIVQDSVQPAAQQWWQWRGEDRTAQVSGLSWPSSFGEELPLQWRYPLGPGYSTPIVAADRVFVTETREKAYEVVHALDRTTGKQLWEQQWEGAMTVPFFAASNGSWIRATPAYDGERLYVAGMRDVLVCLDGKTGKPLWRKDFVTELQAPLPAFGFASSPLLWRGHLYVQAGAGFCKLDKQTGEVLWQSLRDNGGTWGSAFSSPIAATICGVPQLVVQTRTHLAGVAPDDGRVLWKQEITAFRGMNILTPLVIEDAVFTSSYGGRSTLYEISRAGDEWQVTECWSNKTQGYMSTPVLIDNHIYLHLRNQRFTCLNAGTGEIAWTTKPFGKYWSLLANDDQILALDQKGELLLIRANPSEFELLDRQTVADDSWAHVVCCDQDLYVRALDALSAYRWK